jgi:zinc protease
MAGRIEMMRRLLAPLALLAYGCGDTIDDPPVLTAGTESMCTESSEACINAGVEVADLGGVHLIHKQVKGDPIVSLRVLFSATDFDNSPRGVHARRIVRTLLDWRGPDGVESRDWERAWATMGGAFWTFSNVDYAGVAAHVPRTYWEVMWDDVVRALDAPPVDSPDWAITQAQAGYDSELDSPSNAAAFGAWGQIFEGHPYNANRDHLDALAEVTSGDLSEVWAQWRTRGNITVVVVGDVPTDALRARVTAAFGDLDNDVQATDPAPLTPIAASATVTEYPGTATWYVSSTFAAPSIADPDWAALYLATRVLSDRLFEEVREKRGLVYTIASYLTSMRVGYGRLTFSTDRPSETLPVVREVIDELRTVPPTQEEVDAQRNRYRTSFLGSSATNDGLATILSTYHIVGGDRRIADTQFDRLAEVTPQDVSDALDAYFHGLQLAAAGDGEALTADDLLTLSPD